MKKQYITLPPEATKGKISFFKYGLQEVSGVSGKPSVQRNAAITNREIEEFFSGLTHSAVAKIYRKVTEDMKKDGKLR